MTEPVPYHDERYVPKKVSSCYICDRPLDGADSPDHVIPKSIFVSGLPKRPTLPTHPDCNNAKSREDEWFIRQLQKMGSNNAQAVAGLDKLLSKAAVEKNDAGIVGKSKQIRNYKFARTVFKDDKWGMGLMMNGQTYSILHLPPETLTRIDDYMKRLCLGLFLHNVESTAAHLPEISGTQYAYAVSKNTYTAFMQPVYQLYNQSQKSYFMQEWPGQVLYFGSAVSDNPDHGFLFIEFYGEVGYLAAFNE